MKYYRYRVALFLIIAGALVAAAIFNRDSEQFVLLDHHGFSNDPAAQSDSLLGFRLKPDVSMNGFRHNAYGFIGPEFQKQKSKGTFRIFCVGGSTTVGAGVETDLFSYPEILQAIFERTISDGSKRIEVINAGVFGYNSLHTVIQITKTLDAFHPDMYIIMDGLSDLDTAQAVTLTRLKKLSGQTVPDQESGYGIQNIEEKFVLVGYQRNIQRAIEHAKSKGIKVVLVSDPMRIAAEHPARLTGNNPDLAALLAFGRTVLPGINATLAETNGITFVNAQQTTFDPVLDHPRQIARVWADDLHLTRYGYYVLARDVYRRLMAMPAVTQAAGTDTVASDDALDALFPELVLWRPPDGMGWLKEPITAAQ